MSQFSWLQLSACNFSGSTCQNAIQLRTQVSSVRSDSYYAPIILHIHTLSICQGTPVPFYKTKESDAFWRVLGSILLHSICMRISCRQVQTFYVVSNLPGRKQKFCSPRPLGTTLSASTSVERHTAALQVPALLCSSRIKTKALHMAVPNRQFAS